MILDFVNEKVKSYLKIIVHQLYSTPLMGMLQTQDVCLLLLLFFFQYWKVNKPLEMYYALSKTTAELTSFLSLFQVCSRTVREQRKKLLYV